MEAEDLREVYESFSESTHDIDQEQKEVMDDVLESPKDLGVGNYELLPLYGQSRPGVSADNTSEEQDFNRAKHFKMEPTGGCQQLLTCNNTL